VIISRAFLLRIRNVSYKICRENQNTHFMFSNFFFRKYCLLWDNVEKWRVGRHIWQFGACALHAGYVRLHTHTHTHRLLTFKNRASYIQDGRTATLQMLHFIYIYIFFSTNISTEYFKHAAHSPFFSSKCRLFHNATFFDSRIIHIYIEGVLKFKCKTPVPKG
jgi:hypothetical protein